MMLWRGTPYEAQPGSAALDKAVLKFICPKFRQDRQGDFFIGECRRIDANISDLCIKRPAGSKDLRESLSRVFRLQ